LRKIFGAFAILAILAGAFLAYARDSASIAEADRRFLESVQQRNKGALEHILGPDLLWIDSKGKRFSRSQIFRELPAVANADVESQSRTYGNAAVVRANRGRVNVLRVWVKRNDGWRLMLYQEVTQVEKSESPGGTSKEECINPCETIPYEPQTQSEREAIASWQGVMEAIAESNPEAYAPLIADEFTATDTYHDRPYTKADRLAQIAKQKASGQHSAPPELLAAEMFDFGETVMMVAREQRPGAKSYFNTRMWVKRDNRWQMLFSFNTRIE
jgi:hypothetical protein